MFLQNKNTNFYSPKSIRTPLDTWFLFGESLTLKPDSVQKLVLIYKKLVSYNELLCNFFKFPLDSYRQPFTPY